MPDRAAAWWQRGVIYQVYPRSFQDSNADGIGDIPGITSRLDYLRWLGVDAIWISPVYPSPMIDFGYDISDYRDIDQIFGTLEDFDELVASAHDRDIRIVMDFVPNHTSDRHEWFVQSRSSREDARRDWYIWRDPAEDGGPPNNWVAHFGGPAWEFDERTGQYYLHSFLPEQPDLNWRNPEVRAAMYDVLRFWLDRGVDGFRCDVLYQVIKDDQFRDDPPNPDWRPKDGPHERLLHVYSSDRPEVHEVISEIREVLDAYGDKVIIGEIWLPLERLVSYYGADHVSGAHLPLNFQLLQRPWSAATIRGLVVEYESHLPAHGWPNWVLGNHDRHRVASRIGDAQSRVAAMMLLALRGTPTLYYGDEIGMKDVPIPPDRVRDPLERNVPGLGLGRDPARTPMQWDPGPSAGFSDGEPWLPLGEDAESCNVRSEREDPHSLLSLYRALIELRRSEPALSVGSYGQVACRGDVVAWMRLLGETSILVALNLSHEAAEVDLPAMRMTQLLDTDLVTGGEFLGSLPLAPHQGRIVRIR